MPKNESNDRRVQKTRASLQTALLELLHQKPLAKIQIKEIASNANVSRQVFYLHFDSKEDLLFSYIDEVFTKIHQAVFEKSGNANNLRREMPLILSYQQWAKYAEAMQWVMQVENKDLIIDRLREHIALLMDELAEHPETSARKSSRQDHVVDFITGGAYMLLKKWMDGGMKQTPEEMGTLTYQLIINLPNEIG